MNDNFKLRVLETGFNCGSWNMAVDEALIDSAINDGPILRIYGWSQPAVSLGYFQRIKDEVNTEQCQRLNIDILRRITGGGAVFHEGEVTFSFLTSDYPYNVLESYRWVCQIVIDSLQELGYDAKFAPINDIVVNGKKVSGNAQTRKKGVLLQHGTILLDVDFEKMFSVLRVPSEKIRDKFIKEAKDRVGFVDCSFATISKSLKKSACNLLGCDAKEQELSSVETKKANELVSAKYSNPSWTFRK